MAIIVNQPNSSGSLTCLQIIQRACLRIGILSPGVAVNSTDQQIQQLVELSNEAGSELASIYPWSSLQIEAGFPTVATQIQTSIAAITTGFEYIVNDTIWNRSLRRPVYGPVNSAEWQAAIAMQLNGPFNRFRIQGGNIEFYPVPAVGQLCYFEYITNKWVYSSSPSIIWLADTDTNQLDDSLMILSLVWRWKAAKGLAYTEDYDKFESRLSDLMNRDGGKPTLTLTGQSSCDIQPVVLVPSGSWMQ